MHAADGAKAIWGTADRIWTALGDTSDDLNWYTKRATLSAVYGATVLYWLGDDLARTIRRRGSFLDRRIDGVMQFEKLKASIPGKSAGQGDDGRSRQGFLESIRAPKLPG